jgi:hypothetical protein
LAVNDFTRSPLSFNSRGDTLYQKSISIVPITLEIERLISTLCTILAVDEYWTQFEDNALKFVTVPGNMKGMFYDPSSYYSFKFNIFVGNSLRSTPSPKKGNKSFYHNVVTKAAVGISHKSASSIYSTPVLSVNDEGILFLNFPHVFDTKTLVSTCYRCTRRRVSFANGFV